MIQKGHKNSSSFLRCPVCVSTRLRETFRSRTVSLTPSVHPVCVFQRAVRSAGGSEGLARDKGRPTGAGPFQAASSVPAVCRRTAWTPNATATVMLTALCGTLFLLFLSFFFNTHPGFFLISWCMLGLLLTLSSFFPSADSVHPGPVTLVC